MTNNYTTLVDTNILVYSHNELSPHYEKSKYFLEENLLGGKLVISLQNLIEYYSVVTNPKNPGHYSDVSLARDQVKRWIRFFPKVLLPQIQTASTVLTLLEKFPAKGAEVHDVHLAATMIDNGIDTICTADEKIFKKLGLKTINPLT